MEKPNPQTTAKPLTRAQVEILADITHAARNGRVYYGSPGLGSLRVLAERGFIVGKRSDHPWDNKRSWTLTEKGKEANV
jgi:hypothetical protein